MLSHVLRTWNAGVADGGGGDTRSVSERCILSRICTKSAWSSEEYTQHLLVGGRGQLEGSPASRAGRQALRAGVLDQLE